MGGTVTVSRGGCGEWGGRGSACYSGVSQELKCSLKRKHGVSLISKKKKRIGGLNKQLLMEDTQMTNRYMKGSCVIINNEENANGNYNGYHLRPARKAVNQNLKQLMLVRTWRSWQT